MSNSESEGPVPGARSSVAGDLDWVHATLQQAIDELPFYSEEFKAHERKRMSRQMVERIFEFDPMLIRILTQDDEPAGLQIMTPDCGTLFLHWSFVRPEHRRGRIVMHTMRMIGETFQQMDWNKISTLTRTDNRVAIALLRRFKWQETALLERHIFGQDYILFEKMLDKTAPGYRHMDTSGRLGRAARAVRGLFGRD